MKKYSFGSLVLCSTLAFAAAGCSSDGNSNPGTPNTGGGGEGSTQEETLSVLSWWKAPGEAEALQALMDTYQDAYPDVRVTDSDKATSENWRDVLRENLADSPWDVYQLSASDVADVKSDDASFLQSVADIYAEETLKENVIPVIHEATMVDGVEYGVVTGVHRNNSFIYNQQILDEQGLTAPQSLDEYLTLCATLKDAGITPAAAIFQGWALRIMLDEFMAMSLGAQPFYDLIHGGEAPSDDATKEAITKAIDAFDLTLKEYVDVETSRADGYGVFEAAESLHSGDAVMYFHGDWAKGYLVSVGWTGGIDFGVSGPPGASDLFIYGADMFAWPESVPHPTNAHDFLTLVASKEAQIAFNRFKGATPMRKDARDGLDQPGKQAMDDLVNAKVLMKGTPVPAWDDAITAYIDDGDKDALLDAYLTSAP